MSVILAAALAAAGGSFCFTGCSSGGGEQATAYEATAAADPAASTGAQTTEAVPATPYNSLDGKTVVFIGNSAVYYGGCVVNLDQKHDDNGMFKRLCEANGENTKVYDCTYGAHGLKDFVASGCTCGKHQKSSTTPYNGCPGYGADLLEGINLASVDYVFMSETVENNADLAEDCRAIMARFPNPETKFVYVAHAPSYFSNHTRIFRGMTELKTGDGVMLCTWGELVNDQINGKVKHEGASVSYVRNSFTVKKLDTLHPNPLSGYITALMCYCVVTGKDPVGQAFDFCNECTCGKGDGDNCKPCTGFDDFIATYYNNPRNTNFKEVFTEQEMPLLQALMRNYLKDYLITED